MPLIGACLDRRTALLEGKKSVEVPSASSETAQVVATPGQWHV